MMTALSAPNQAKLVATVLDGFPYAYSGSTDSGDKVQQLEEAFHHQGSLMRRPAQSAGAAQHQRKVPRLLRGTVAREGRLHPSIPLGWYVCVRAYSGFPADTAGIEF